MEWLDPIWTLWKILPREQKEGLVMFLVSFPLGILSLIVGIHRSDYLLAGAGATNLVAGVLVVLIVGSMIVVLAYRLLKLLFTLPFTLWRRRSAAAAKSSAKRLEADRGRTGQKTQGWDWFDTLFLCWVLLQILQVFQISRLLGSPAG